MQEPAEQRGYEVGKRGGGFVTITCKLWEEMQERDGKGNVLPEHEWHEECCKENCELDAATTATCCDFCQVVCHVACMGEGSSVVGDYWACELCMADEAALA